MSSSALDRRSFLRGAAAGGVGAAAGLTTLVRPAQALTCPALIANPWGSLSGTITGSGAQWTSGNYPCYKILEINLPGGASQWETLWLSDSVMLPNSNGYPDFTVHDLAQFPLDNVIWSGAPGYSCSPNAADPALPTTQQVGGSVYPESKNYRYFGNDISTKIYWGAPAKPLWMRNDILSRCRMVTQFHDLDPHEAAIPFGLTGLRLGNGRMAGTGAAIEHRAKQFAQAPQLPTAYILHFDADVVASIAATTGQHGGVNRPLVIKVQQNNAFYDNLGRTNITAESDRLFHALRYEYRDRLIFPSTSSPVRSGGFDGYWAAAELLAGSTNLRSLFVGGLLDVNQHMGNVNVCPTYPTTGTNPNTFATGIYRPGVKTMLNAAATLLSPTGPANYVCVIDRGLAGDYDTHDDGKDTHLQRTSANLYDLFKQLADIIAVPSGGSVPAGKINLDETLVVITTEFGRTPWINGKGRDHFPRGYVTTFIGGPIPSTGTNNGTIAGGIDRSTGYTDGNHQYTPTDVRGAILLAAGIDPFASGNFAETDFSSALKGGSNSQPVIRDRLRSVILGA